MQLLGKEKQEWMKKLKNLNNKEIENYFKT